jgi:hypothetical protein
MTPSIIKNINFLLTPLRSKAKKIDKKRIPRILEILIRAIRPIATPSQKNKYLRVLRFCFSSKLIL